MALVDHWPLFGLEVHTPLLVLRYPDEDLSLELVELAERGVHDPSTMPFLVPWTDDPPRAHLQHLWRNRADWKPDGWHLQLVALLDGVVVGTQAVSGTNFAARRTAETGSWVGLAHQGRGIGKEMRAAILHLAFAGLDARIATTAAWHDNAASLAVTRALCYEPNGSTPEMRRERAEEQLRFVLTRQGWEARRRDDIELVGLEPCLSMFGCATPSSAGAS
ncbi:MAG: GNAT family N-acetyltransferase [Acidimicrobiales bacterium]